MPWPWARLEAKIDTHAAQDDARFESILAAMQAHDGNVERRHIENQGRADKTDAVLRDTTAAINELKGSYGVFADLLPALRAGIVADQRIVYRKKRLKQIALAVVSTLVFVATMVPLVDAIAGLRISLHFAGH